MQKQKNYKNKINQQQDLFSKSLAKTGLIETDQPNNDHMDDTGGWGRNKETKKKKLHQT